MKDDHVAITRVISAGFEENCYIVQLAGRTDALVVDPGLEPDKILEYLESRAVEPAAMLLTHGHGDHIAGNAAIKQRWPHCPIVCGRNEAPKLLDPELNLSALFGLPMVSPPADILVDDGQLYRAAGFELEVLEVPGHSAGHVVYLWRDHQPPIAFVGDVIFAGSIGRTDFPDGDYQALVRGIAEKLFTLPEDTILLSGHGPPTTVGEERRSNPFVGGRG